MTAEGSHWQSLVTGVTAFGSHWSLECAESGFAHHDGRLGERLGKWRSDGDRQQDYFGTDLKWDQCLFLTFLVPFSHLRISAY